MVGADARRPIGASDTVSLLRCVRRLQKTTYDNYEIIVVDDGSLPDTTRAALHTDPQPPGNLSIKQIWPAA